MSTYLFNIRIPGPSHSYLTQDITVMIKVWGYLAHSFIVSLMSNSPGIRQQNVS